MSDTPQDKPKQRRGLAAMSPEKRREIARMGGASLRPEQRSFSQDRELAKRAGKKGGGGDLEKARAAWEAAKGPRKD